MTLKLSVLFDLLEAVLFISVYVFMAILLPAIALTFLICFVYFIGVL